MSMSTHVFAFYDDDADYKRKQAAYRSCVDADIEPPDELCNLFSRERVCTIDAPPGPPVPTDVLDRATENYTGDCEEGKIIDVFKLPKGTRYIAVVNSY